MLRNAVCVIQVNFATILSTVALLTIKLMVVDGGAGADAPGKPVDKVHRN